MTTATLKKQDASSKLTDLKHQRADIKTAIERLTRTPKSSILADAEKLLRIGTHTDSSDHREQHQKLSRELAVLDEAIRLQEIVVGKEQAQANFRQWRENQPEHAALLRDVLAKLKEAEAAAAKLETFYATVENAVHRRMSFFPFGEFDRNRFENVERWEAELHEFDCLKDVVE